jgi:hypothetical protein
LKPFGVVFFGTAARPNVSVAWISQRRLRMSISSFQSASSCTRPCCIRTPEKRFRGLSVNRE